MTESESDLQKQIIKLHQLMMYGRWLVVVCCWLTFGLYGIWGLREEFSLLKQYFTWSGLRYGLAFNPIPSLCLTFAISMTAAVLVRQSQIVLKGLSPREQYQLEQKVKKIQETGRKHPLWKWVIGNSE